MSEVVEFAAPRRARSAAPQERRTWAPVAGLGHGLRAREFGLLPEEPASDWARHLAEVRAALAPQDPLEEMLVTALAAALFQAIRADRIECEVLADIPSRPGRNHGTDLQERHHATALSAALRYQSAAGAAVQRAQRMLLTHRKARLDGLLPDPALPAPSPADTDMAPGLHEDTAKFGTPEPDAAPEPAAEPALGRRAPGSGAGLDDAGWLASLPPVEADPAREAKRRELLLQVEPPLLRRAVGMGSLSAIECLLLPDMAAYEEWFARQPKPERVAASSLTAEHAAMVEAATRHNPPWIKGEYLSYWRPPVPKELCEQRGRPAPAARPPAGQESGAAPPATIATPLAALRARVARLLDRTAPRRPDELDLAEAVCALRWPHWGPYRGPVDLELLRRALDGHTIDGKTLTWLDSHPFAEQCRKGEG